MKYKRPLLAALMLSPLLFSCSSSSTKPSETIRVDFYTDYVGIDYSNLVPSSENYISTSYLSAAHPGHPIPGGKTDYKVSKRAQEGYEYTWDKWVGYYETQQGVKGEIENGYEFDIVKTNEILVSSNDKIIQMTLFSHFDIALCEYAVNFFNYDKSTLYETKAKYGETAVYAGVTPTKPEDLHYTYAFDSWDKSLENIKAVTNVTATFAKTNREYAVTFLDKDGNAFSPAASANVAYGSALTQKPSDFGGVDSYVDAGDTYNFSTWSGTYVADPDSVGYELNDRPVDPSCIRYTCSVKAVYVKASVPTYTVTYLNYDGTTNSTVTVEKDSLLKKIPKLGEIDISGVASVHRKKWTLQGDTTIIDPETYTVTSNISLSPLYATKSVTVTQDDASTLVLNYVDYRDGYEAATFTPSASFDGAISQADFYPSGVTDINGLPVNSIGDSVFSYCHDLLTVDMPDTMLRVGNQAFQGCESMTSIFLPSNVETCGRNAFLSCFAVSIKLEASAIPTGFHSKWNPDNRPYTCNATR